MNYFRFSFDSLWKYVFAIKFSSSTFAICSQDVQCMSRGVCHIAPSRTSQLIGRPVKCPLLLTTQPAISGVTRLNDFLRVVHEQTLGPPFSWMFQDLSFCVTDCWQTDFVCDKCLGRPLAKQKREKKTTFFYQTRQSKMTRAYSTTQCHWHGCK